MERKCKSSLIALLCAVAAASPTFAEHTRLALSETARTADAITYCATASAGKADEQVEAVDLLIDVPDGCLGNTYDLTLLHSVGTSPKSETAVRLELTAAGEQWLVLQLPAPVSPAGEWSVAIRGAAPHPTATSLYLLSGQDASPEPPAETTVIVERQPASAAARTTTVIQTAPVPVVVRPTKVTRAYRGARHWRYHARLRSHKPLPGKVVRHRAAKKAGPHPAKRYRSSKPPRKTAKAAPRKAAPRRGRR
jgi:hypothetical protein